MRNTIEKAQERLKSNTKHKNDVKAGENSRGEKQEQTKDLDSNDTTRTEIQDVTKTPELYIDQARLSSQGMVSVTGERTLINEEFREIKRKLISNGFGQLSKTLKNSNIIMVSSARPSEGKTFTAVNLALSIAAEQDKTVLLVDADVLKPNVLKTLGVDERQGLMEFLTGEISSISEVLYHTNIDKLKIIPSGKTHRLSTELLASKKMHDTIDEFANRYPDRVVIIDTPPIIGIAESAVLANFAGQALVVVEENKSKINDIKEAVNRLNPEMAIGFVVNKSINSQQSNAGYYGYHAEVD
ncbi:MAG: exopolysaccharide biosynthesis protein [Alteromonas sp.]|nr:exopolysaccharide biosynthesis protein [Alteromonas sp.]